MVQQTQKIQLIEPEWPSVPGIKAFSTTRSGGVSTGNFAGLNLGAHVADDSESVQHNREQLASVLGIELQEIQWLRQVHGTEVVNLREICPRPIQADASFTKNFNTVCAVMTADCLPVLFASLDGGCVAAAHAGWRGLQQGVLENTVALFPDPAQIQVWLGPAISQAAFEVGEEVRAAFCQKNRTLEVHFVNHKAGKWMADIYGLARSTLKASGIHHIYGGDYCTYSDERNFYSYRRDGTTGRMASLIWKEQESVGK